MNIKPNDEQLVEFEQLGITISDYQSSDYLKTDEEIELYLKACVDLGGDNADFMAKCLANVERARLRMNDPESILLRPHQLGGIL